MDKYYKDSDLRRKIIWILVAIAVLATFVITASATMCKHESVDYIITIEPTCTTKGEGQFICNDCNKVLEVYLPSAIGHEFGEYVVTKEPTPNTNGEEVAICTRCEYVDNREFVCPHSTIIDVISVEPTCTEQGKMNTMCERCQTMLVEKTIETKEHNVEKFEITVKPTTNTNGIQTGICVNCENTVEKEYVCPHENTKNETVKTATCQNMGEINVICELCKKVLKTKQTNIVECTYGDWEIVKAATPIENGEKAATCIWCKNKIFKSYSLNLGNNYIYVKGTKLQGKMVISSFTQSAIDKNDIVYSTGAIGANNPFILGHNYGTMQYIKQLNIGDIVYVSVNGNVKTYKVVVSEYGLQNSSWTDIVGQTSGHSIWDNLGGETLHMYTCYGSNKNGRWMVLAIEV